MDLDNRVVLLEVTQARLEERVSDQEEYRRKQNNTLERLEEKLDSKMQKVDDKLDRLNWWLVGLMGGVITSLVLLLANLTTGG